MQKDSKISNKLPSFQEQICVDSTYTRRRREGVEKASRRRRQFFLVKLKIKICSRLTKTEVHCPREQGLEFEASNWFVQILKFEKSFDDLYTRLDNLRKIFF